jgi:hypothetical protein
MRPSSLQEEDMLKKHMAACLVATAFMTLPVLAQTSTAPSATAPSASPPAATAPSATPPAASAQSSEGAASRSAASGQFVTQQETDQWRGSRLVGLDVYGSDNQKIGDINELLVDRQGNIDAVVIGVGGFLGIGEKNVAVPLKSLEFVLEDTRRTAGAGTGTSSPGTTASTTAGSGTDRPATTATTGSGTGAARSAAERGYPDHAVLRMSKADLQSAPTFRYAGDTRTDDRSGAARGTGTGASSPSTAPRQ